MNKIVVQTELYKFGWTTSQGEILLSKSFDILKMPS